MPSTVVTSTPDQNLLVNPQQSHRLSPVRESSREDQEGSGSSSNPGKVYAFYAIRKVIIQALACTAQHWSRKEPLLVDSGAALHVCHPQFAKDYPLEPLPEDLWNLQLHNADGSKIEVYGARFVLFEMVAGLYIFLRFVVCNVSSAILSIPSLLDHQGTAAFEPEDLHINVEGCRIPFNRSSMGSYLLTPLRRVPHQKAYQYEPNAIKIAPVNQQSTRGYSCQADYWLLDATSRTLTRMHKRLRQNRFNPLTAKLKDGCPLKVPDDLEDDRVIRLRREGSNQDEIIKDSNWKAEVHEVKGGLGYSYRGETQF